MRGALRLRVVSCIGLLAAGAVFLLPLASEQETEAAGHKTPKVRAFANITGCTDSWIRGRAILVEEPSDEGVKVVRIAMKVRGLPDGKHGVHIHETADCVPCGEGLDCEPDLVRRHGNPAPLCKLRSGELEEKPPQLLVLDNVRWG